MNFQESTSEPEPANPVAEATEASGHAGSSEPALKNGEETSPSAAPEAKSGEGGDSSFRPPDESVAPIPLGDGRASSEREQPADSSLAIEKRAVPLPALDDRGGGSTLEPAGVSSLGTVEEHPGQRPALDEREASLGTVEEQAARLIAQERAASAPAPAAAREPDFRTLKRHHVAPGMIAIERIDDDDTFRVAADGDISQLATDIARLGQLFPVDLRLKPPDRFQIICGFRRVAALRFLQRDRVLARLHTDLSDEDALLMALTSAIHARPVTAEELEGVKARLERDGKLTPATRSMIEKALSPEDDLAPETVDEGEEVDADELAQQVTLKLGEINQELSLLADVFDSLDESRQAQLLEQLGYSSDLVKFLEGRR
jgi:ParB-like chromosome segregation protein Spo0J